MLILAIIVIGMTAGLLAHLLVDRHSAVDWPRLFVVGIAGSFVGGTLASLLMGDGFGIGMSGLFGSVVGAVILLSATRLLHRI